jgi:riboflavin synthase
LFTGIIETMGIIQDLRRVNSAGLLTLSAPLFSSDLKVGDSVAVNGVCLTAVRCVGESFSFDLSSETLARTSFARVKKGTRVNLERALLVGSRMGGHFVQGHVDAVGCLNSAVANGEGSQMTIEFPRELERYLVSKGSVAVDGISLTIAALRDNRFTLALIPHTLHETNLGFLRPGDPVNLEVDILAKYLERFFQLDLAPGRSHDMDIENLKEQGF